MTCNVGARVESKDLDLNYEEMDDIALLDALENSSEVRDIVVRPGWKIIDAACKRTAARARKALEDADPENKTYVIQLQQIVKLYGNVIHSLISTYKQEGELAFGEAKKRGLLDRIFG